MTDLENYPDDLNRKQAEDLVRKVANEIQVERGIRKTDIKIKNNPFRYRNRPNLFPSWWTEITPIKHFFFLK